MFIMRRSATKRYQRSHIELVFNLASLSKECIKVKNEICNNKENISSILYFLISKIKKMMKKGKNLSI